MVNSEDFLIKGEWLLVSQKHVWNIRFIRKSSFEQTEDTFYFSLAVHLVTNSC